MDPITIKFSSQHLDYLYLLLTRAPWAEADPIIASVRAQVRQQQEASPPVSTERPAEYPQAGDR
jgi:hypothetical protein